LHRKKILIIAALLFCTSHTAKSQSLFSKNDIQITRVKSDSAFVKMYVQFWLEKNGKTDNIIVKKVACTVCTDSVLERMAKESVKFIENLDAAKLKAKKDVRIQFTLPILYKLKD
jgi:hypothetical protein